MEQRVIQYTYIISLVQSQVGGLFPPWEKIDATALLVWVLQQDVTIDQTKHLGDELLLSTARDVSQYCILYTVCFMRGGSTIFSYVFFMCPSPECLARATGVCDQNSPSSYEKGQR